MRLKKLKIIALASSFVALVFSCRDTKTKTPIRAMTVVSTDSGYKWQEITFNTLKNLKRMDGDIAKIIGSSVVNLKGQSGDVLTKEPSKIYLSQGKSVNLRYRMDNGVAIPLDFHSAAMLSAYYNFEKVVEFWQDNLNLDMQELGKFRIMYNPSEELNGAGTNITVTERINASFLAGTGDFWLWDTSKLEDIPIKMNLGIIAHEFGHAIWNLAFSKKDITFSDGGSSYNDWKLHGMNEGLADFFSWMVTSRTDEASKSLGILKKYRDLPVSWTSQTLAANPKVCVGDFYCMGSVLASSLFEISNLPGNNAITVGKQIYAALDKFRDDWSAYKEDKDFDYYYLLNRIVDEAEPTKAKDYCTYFRKWFNDSVNQKGLNKSCS